MWLPTIVRLAGCGLLLAIGLLWHPRLAVADESNPPGESQAATEGVLVMRTGTIVSGKILRSGNLYEVQGASGKWAVPEDLVKMRCASIPEAYLKLRESAQKQDSANAHITLARWCLTNHLDKEAVQELQDALMLEPDREDAKRLLRNAEETLQTGKDPVASPNKDKDSPTRITRLAAATNDDAISLGGLSREQALQFSRRIQPLLVNNCTAAGCHGRDAQTSFRLYKITPGKDANRHAAERNLAEVLEFIDFKKPRSSSLLTVPRGKHGRRGRPVFAGQRGDEQLAELEKWVVAVAREETVREKRNESDGHGKDQVQQASASDEKRDLPPSGTGARNALPASRPSPTGGSNSSLPKQAPLPPGRGDPFDPAAFNRGTDRCSGR